MKYLYIAPAVAVMVLSFTASMLETAEAVQEKTLRHVDSMNSALECAFMGIDLNVCSPGIYAYDYSAELNSTRESINNISDDIMMYYDEDGRLVKIKRVN